MNSPSVPSDDNALQPDRSSTVAEDRHWIASAKMVGVLTFFSRIAGLIRDMGMAALFGNGPLLDSFTLAFRIPNLCRRLFGEGALTTAFLPEFIRAENESKQTAEQLATAVFLTLAGGLTGLVLLIEVVLFVLMSASSPGSNSEQIYWMTACMLPYAVLVCLSAQLAAVLHTWGEFFIPAFVPLLLNLVWILALWLVTPYLVDKQDQMLVVILSVLLGGFLQLLVPWIVVRRRGFRLRRDWGKQWANCVKVFRMMLPVVFGLSLTQLNAICDSTLAWWFSQPEQGEWVAPGTASALYFGQRMYQFPLGVFGVALGTVMFARLSRQRESGDYQEFSRDVMLGIRLLMMVGFPATLGMVILATPLTECLLQRGEFDYEDTLQTSHAVAAYGYGIWAFLGVSLIQRFYYALEDVVTPVRIGMLSVGLNLLLNIPFLFWLGGSGLAFATSVAAVIQCLILLVLLGSRTTLRFDAQFWSFTGKLLLATFCMSCLCYGLKIYPVFISKSWGQWGNLLLTLGLSIIVYFALLKLMKVQELNQLSKSKAVH